MALDLNTTNKAHRVKVNSSQLKTKSESVDPWDRPIVSPLVVKKDSLDPEGRGVNKESIGNQLVINKEPIGNQLVTKEEAIGNQLVTNKEPISNQLVTKEEAISNQLVTTLVTNKEPISNQLVTKEEAISNQLVTKEEAISNQLVTTLVTNKEPISNQLVTKTTFKELSGLQRKIIIQIFNDIKFSNEKISKPMSLEHLSRTIETTNHTAKTAIQRLIKKEIMKREGGKRGKGGWAQFSINKQIYDEMLQNELVTNWGSISNQLVTNKGPNWESNAPSSSSSFNITTTTYRADALINSTIILSEKLVTVGFNQGHLDQLLRDSSLAPEDIQNSLDAFAFDLSFEDVKKKVRSPIGLIMKLLKTGQVYVSEKGYESEEDRLYRELVERSEKNNLEKKTLKAKLIEVKFEEWLENTSDEDKRRFVEPIGEFMGMIHLEELKEYFKKEIYNANDIH